MQQFLKTPGSTYQPPQNESMADQDIIEVRLDAIRFGARDISLFELRRPDGAALPEFSAGSHIDVHLPNGVTRQYSLVDVDNRCSVYVIGVKREPNSRGGSSYLHEKARVGAVFTISAPRNNFPLNEAANHSVLIAGGIGVTPIFTMWGKLKSLGRAAEMHYCARSRTDAVFLDALQSDANVRFNFDDENAGRFLDIASILESTPKDSHLYCCGPGPMLKAFESAASNWPAEQVHVEYFTAPAEQARAGGFVVELAKSQKVLTIEPGQTILSALLDAGIDAPYSCEEGVCGACMTTVIEGDPDHRDSVLTLSERKENKKIMVCCSGSKTPRLILDL